MVADDPHEQLLALVDTALVSITRARGVAGRWAPSTAEAYAKQWPLFDDWCRPRGTGGNPPRWLTPLPCTAETLALYVGHLADAGWAPATIRKAKAAIIAWHRLHGQPVPDGMPASLVLSDHQARLAEGGWKPKRAEVLTADDIVRIVASMATATPQGCRDACLVLLAYTVMYPAGQLVRLTIDDVEATGDGLLLHPRDPDRELVVRHWHLGGVHHPQVCPVEATTAWVGWLARRGAEADSRLFRSIDQHHNIAGIDVPRSGQQSSGVLSTRGLASLFTGILNRAGVPDPGRYSVQSLRAGGILNLRIEGATVDELAAAAGLSTHSVSLLDHIRTAETMTGTRPA